MTTKIERGDWQTPIALARSVLEVVRALPEAPATILEPTCGEGAFLRAAAEIFPTAERRGWELNPDYARTARVHADVRVADFFDLDWEAEIATFTGPLLFVGNPPWVTSAQLGTIGSSNHPTKTNFKRLSGYDALTGKSNFDVSEWMILRLLEAVGERPATFAFLCKSAVARRVIELAPKRGGGLWRIDAMEHFDAAVDAVLFVIGHSGDGRWPVYASLDAKTPESWLGVENGTIVADADRYARTSSLIGVSDPEWRSGLKHDCARVMELEPCKAGFVNGLGEAVEIEHELVFPLLKSSDVANGRSRHRAVIVPQRTLGADTTHLRASAPKAWAYLQKHRGVLAARKSSIYDGQPAFAIFGIGAYSFAPWKVAVSGLYKRFSPTLVGPLGDKPVMLDDTCYFLPFEEEADARRAIRALRSSLASDFLHARIFWDSKRPIRKSILQSLNLAALERELST